MAMARMRPNTMASMLPGITMSRSTLPAAWVKATRAATSEARAVSDLTAWRAKRPPTKMMAAEM